LQTRFIQGLRLLIAEQTLEMTDRPRALHSELSWNSDLFSPLWFNSQAAGNSIKLGKFDFFPNKPDHLDSAEAWGNVVDSSRSHGTIAAEVSTELEPQTPPTLENTPFDEILNWTEVCLSMH
jgi:hypothetical protein